MTRREKEIDKDTVRESKREWGNIRRMGTMTRKTSGINERRKAVCVCL